MITPPQQQKQRKSRIAAAQREIDKFVKLNKVPSDINALVAELVSAVKDDAISYGFSEGNDWANDKGWR